MSTTTSPASVDVVVTAYNHAHFLGDALASIVAQTQRPAAVTVVDDGSEDDPASVVSAFSGVRLIRQPNAGLAAARNAGLRAAASRFIVFLDADDRLERHALEAGLHRFAEVEQAAFVYGGHRRFLQSGARGPDTIRPIGTDAYADFLRGNPIGMHATVIYRRDALEGCGGFDETLRRCEDYDVYLRVTRDLPIAYHSEIVAEYRWHDANMSHDHAAMLRAVLAVHDRHEVVASGCPAHRAAWLEGRRSWHAHYFDEMIDAAKHEISAGQVVEGCARLARALAQNPGQVLPKLERVLRNHRR